MPFTNSTLPVALRVDLNRAAGEAIDRDGQDVWCQCARCGASFDVPVIRGRARHAHVQQHDKQLTHARCGGSVRAYGRSDDRRDGGRCLVPAFVAARLRTIKAGAV